MKPAEEESVKLYLLAIDRCLLRNSCLNYHQILSYKHKLNGSPDDSSAAVAPGGHIPLMDSMQNSSLDDLQLAEVNYLCILQSMDEI